MVMCFLKSQRDFSAIEEMETQFRMLRFARRLLLDTQCVGVCCSALSVAPSAVCLSRSTECDFTLARVDSASTFGETPSLDF